MLYTCNYSSVTAYMVSIGLHFKQLTRQSSYNNNNNTNTNSTTSSTTVSKCAADVVSLRPVVTADLRGTVALQDLQQDSSAQPKGQPHHQAGSKNIQEPSKDGEHRCALQLDVTA